MDTVSLIAKCLKSFGADSDVNIDTKKKKLTLRINKGFNTNQKFRIKNADGDKLDCCVKTGVSGIYFDAVSCDGNQMRYVWWFGAIKENKESLNMEKLLYISASNGVNLNFKSTQVFYR